MRRGTNRALSGSIYRAGSAPSYVHVESRPESVKHPRGRGAEADDQTITARRLSLDAGRWRRRPIFTQWMHPHFVQIFKRPHTRGHD